MTLGVVGKVVGGGASTVASGPAPATAMTSLDAIGQK